MKLYEFGPTRSIRARWTLQELGVDFEAITVNLMAGEHQRPEFLKINPAGRIPVLVDGDLVLTESVAIVLYLGEKYAEKRLIPTDLTQRAQMNRWLLFAATELEQPLWRISRHTALVSEGAAPACRRRDRQPGVQRNGSRAGEAHARPAVCRGRERHGRRFRCGLHTRLGQ